MIISSPLGMYSNLPEPFIISIIENDGKINLLKMVKVLDDIKHQGATAIRDFYWCLGNEHLAPFNANTLEFNNQYWENQKIIAKNCNARGLRYIYCLFNNCETKNRDEYSMYLFSPWRKFIDYFYGPDAKEQREKLIKKAVQTFSGLDVGFDMCNESEGYALSFNIHVFSYLMDLKVDMSKVILGIDYYKKESVAEYKNLYFHFKKAIMDKYGESWGDKLKTVCWSTVHQCNLGKSYGCNLIEFLNDTKENGLRNIIFSFDGTKHPDPNGGKLRPDRREAFELAEYVKSKKPIDVSQGQIGFEAVYGKWEKDRHNCQAAGFYEALNNAAPVPIDQPSQIAEIIKHLEYMIKAQGEQILNLYEFVGKQNVIIGDNVVKNNLLENEIGLLKKRVEELEK